MLAVQKNLHAIRHGPHHHVEPFSGHQRQFSAPGNLDPATSDQVFGTLMDLVRSTGLAAVIATHNLELAARMDRTVRLDQGRIV